MSKAARLLIVSGVGIAVAVGMLTCFGWLPALSQGRVTSEADVLENGEFVGGMERQRSRRLQ